MSVNVRSVCCGSLGKFLNLAEPLCLRVHMGMLHGMEQQLLQTHSVMSFWQGLVRGAGNSCKAGNTQWLDFQRLELGPGHESVDFTLVPIRYTPRVGFLSLLLFPLCTSFSILPQVSGLSASLLLLAYTLTYFYPQLTQPCHCFFL